ncbi:MAG: hypothetical protein NTX59_04510 [Elusimicrobia bacterium]|nr:hypothetical protein [Elusimicrobiota bacterium]
MEKKKSIFSGIPPANAPGWTGGGGLKGVQPTPMPPPPPKVDLTAELPPLLAPLLAPLKEEIKKFRDENSALKAELKKLKEELIVWAVEDPAKEKPAVEGRKVVVGRNVSDTEISSILSRLETLYALFSDFAKTEAKASFHLTELKAARKAAILEMEGMKRDTEICLKKNLAMAKDSVQFSRARVELDLQLKNFDERIAGMEKKLQASVDEIGRKFEALTAECDKRFETFKKTFTEESAAAAAVEYKRTFSLTKSLKERMETLERDYQIVLKNKLLLLEAKAQAMETLTKKQETSEDKP